MIYKDITNSSQITRVEYYEDAEILVVTFKKGTVYKYIDVPYGTLKELLGAESVGRYFNLHIAKKFQFEKVG